MPATTVAPTTTTQLPEDAADPYVWTRLDPPALGGGAATTLAAVLAPGAADVWTVAGTRIAPSGSTAATLWTSPDGRSWSSSPLSMGLADSSSAMAAAEWRDTTVVVGSTSGTSGTEAAAWVSEGPQEPFAPAEVSSSATGSVMTAVAAGPLGLFATGTVDGHFALWSSTDGAAWTESPAAEKVIDSAPSAEVTSLLAQGETVYAAGSVRDGVYTDAALWASNDGIAWYQVGNTRSAFAGDDDETIGIPRSARDRSCRGGHLERRWPRPAGVVDLPRRGQLEPTVHRLRDRLGRGKVAPVSGRRGAIRLVVHLPCRNHVARGGRSGARPARRRGDRLTGSNGRLCRYHPAPPSQMRARATIVASGQGSAIVADSDWGQPHLLSLVGSAWSEPSADPKVFGPVQAIARPIAVAASGRRVAVTVDVSQAPQLLGQPAAVHSYSLLSADSGVSWTMSGALATSAIRPPPGARSVTRSGSGWLAVGTSGSGIATAWTSADGTNWQPRPMSTGVPGETAVPLAVCKSARGVVAVGTTVILQAPESAKKPAAGITTSTAPTAETPPAGEPPTTTPSRPAPARSARWRVVGKHPWRMVGGRFVAPGFRSRP